MVSFLFIESLEVVLELGVAAVVADSNWKSTFRDFLLYLAIFLKRLFTSFWRFFKIKYLGDSGMYQKYTTPDEITIAEYK